MKKVFKHKDKIIGLIVSVIFIGLIFWNLDVHKLFKTLKVFNESVLFIVIPLYVVSLYLRGLRWKFLLCSSKISTKEAFMAFTTGNTINSYLPARAGDFWRACHIGNSLGESKMKILGSIVLERIIDGISVLLLLLFAIFTYFRHGWVIEIAGISALLFLGALAFFYVLFKTEKLKHLSKFFERFMQGFEALDNPLCFWGAFFMSIPAWILECLVTYILISAFGYELGFSAALFVISFVALSTVIPSSSIFVGPYQFAYILALSIYHLDKSSALGIAFVHQLTIMVVITLISSFYFISGGDSLKKIEAEIKEAEKKKADNEQYSKSK